MPYHKQQQRILSGSLNLVPPSDQIHELDALQLENWRVDEAGQLRSRRGMVREAQLTGYPGISRFFRSGLDRYAVVGSSVHYGAALATSAMLAGVDDRGTAFAAYQGRVFMMNGASRRMFKGPTAFWWGIDAPGTAPAALPSATPASLTGTFTYYVTFGDDFDGESNPSPVSVSVPVTSTGVDLSNIPVSISPSVTRRYIYRVGGGVLSAMRTATIEDNSTTTLTDTVTVAEQQILEKSLSFDYDPPPAARGLIGPYFGRLVAWRTLDHPERLFWSKTAQPWAWPGAADPDEGNWIDVGGSGDDLLVATFHKRRLHLYKERSIWRLDGDPDVNDPEQTNSDVGIWGPQAVASSGGADYFGGGEGIYMFNGDREQEISQKIRPIFRGEYTKVGNTHVPPLNRDAASRVVMACRYGRLYVSYPSDGATENNATLVCDLATGRWYQHRHSASLGNRGFTTLYDEGSGSGFGLLGAVRRSNGSDAYLMEQGAADQGTAIPVVYQTRFLDQGLPDHEKVYQDVTVEYSCRDEGDDPAPTLTVEALWNNGETVETVGTLTGTGRQRAVMGFAPGFAVEEAPGRMARNVSIRITGETQSNVRLFGVTLNYYPEPRWADTYDSQPFDGGSRLLKEWEAVEVEIAVEGTVRVALWSDGGSSWGDDRLTPAVYKLISTQRRGLTAMSAEGFTISGYHGVSTHARRYQVVISAEDASSRFKLYACRVKLRPVGVIVSTPEPWYPAPLLL